MRKKTHVVLASVLVYLMVVSAASAQVGESGWLLFSGEEERPGIYDADDGEREDTPLFLGVRHEKLFSHIGFDIAKRGLSPFGVTYRNSVQEGELPRLSAVSLAVYPTLDKARIFYRAHQSRFAVGPREIGSYRDARYLCWGRKNTGGTAVMRARNLIVLFSYVGTVDFAKGKLFKIVDALLTDDTVARTGAFSTNPKISNRGQITRSNPTKDGFQIINPRIQGMGAEDKLMVRASHGGYGVTAAKRDSDGNLRIMSRSNSQPTEIHLYIANEENLFIFEKIDGTKNP